MMNAQHSLAVHVGVLGRQQKIMKQKIERDMRTTRRELGDIVTSSGNLL